MITNSRLRKSWITGQYIFQPHQVKAGLCFSYVRKSKVMYDLCQIHTYKMSKYVSEHHFASQLGSSDLEPKLIFTVDSKLWSSVLQNKSLRLELHEQSPQNLYSQTVLLMLKLQRNYLIRQLMAM